MVRLFTLGSVALFDREGTHLSGEATQSKRLALLAWLAVGGDCTDATSSGDPDASARMRHTVVPVRYPFRTSA